jgi:prepilin-type N-terminal cleavage/methylation domain-containing protein
MEKSKANLQTTHTSDGFSTIELLVVIAIMSIVTSFGVMGIQRAKASIRLSGAAREYASYIEKARLYSIRTHAEDASERANVAINDSKTSYNVNLDLDGDGVLDTRTIPLPAGVTFETVETIGFDWRGRTWNTVGALSMDKAQVSITLRNEIGTASVDITGSGDVTIDSQVFDDNVPDVSLKIGDLASGATPVPTPSSVATATPTPDASATPDSSGGTISVPTPTPDLSGTFGDISTPTPTPTPTATPTPTPTATPTPTPTPEVCSLTADSALLIIHQDGTGTIKISHNSSSSQTISASSSKPSDLQVTPNNQSVSAGGSATFTVKSKRSVGIYSVTFSSGCGSKTIPVTVIL